MPLTPRPPPPPQAVLFYSGFGFCVADLRTQTEVSGPFETLDDAWVNAKARGYVVTDVLRTRGFVKHRPVEREHVA